MKDFLQLSTTPPQVLITKAVKLMETLSTIVGFNFVKVDYRLSWISITVIFDCISYLIINAYDVTEFWGNITQVCFCLVTWTFGYQVLEIF